MLGRLVREDDNPVDKRYRWMLGHLARADDHVVDKRRVWDCWRHALKLAEEFDNHTPEDREEYRARRNEHFPEYVWDDEPHTVNAYVTLIYQCLGRANKDIDRALHCRNMLLNACRSAEAAWRHEAARLNPQLAPAAAVTPLPRLPLAPSSSEAPRGARSQPY
jgi:hypothetical protein